MSHWYQQALDLHVLKEFGDETEGEVHLTDQHYDAGERNTIMILRTPRPGREQERQDQVGPFISAIVYEADDLEQAFGDAIWAGMEEVDPPTLDPVTGILTATLREPSGNEILLRQASRVTAQEQRKAS